MPYYQVTTKQGSRVYNQDIESNSIENVKQLYKALSVAFVSEIKEYIYIRNIKKVDSMKSAGKARITLNFSDSNPKVIYIPKFKKGVNLNDLKHDLKKFYPTLNNISLKIT